MAWPPDIDERIRQDFSDRDVPAAVDLLADYIGPEPPRMRRCLLYLAKGDLEKLTHFVKEATVDFRDVIMAAEYEGDRRVRDFSKPFG